ncbi:MAG: molybdenum cofactor biosynthesis protein MoaD [Betaproteobacteria bacterium SG8_40]|jgi:molybdopterin synthase sulfur carrier subunit|nr:MAG: molybdenum cofactor biosynthesis protein MoaD [Betaproteobacteria bacterium SG8_40]
MKANETQTATVKVLYFARLREALGKGEEEIVLPEGVDTVGALAGFLRSRGGAWAAELGVGKAVRVAVNQDMAAPETRISGGEEIAFFPPVTGG